MAPHAQPPTPPAPSWARTCLWPLRRFATIDPARDGWNFYTYARDNPVKYIDPDGRFSKAEGASIAVSFVPVIGDLKDFQETITGLDLITGETLSPFERGLTGLSAILPIVGGAALRKVVGGADEALSVADDIVSKGKAPGYLGPVGDAGAEGLLRMERFRNLAESGFQVGEESFSINPHLLNSLRKSGRRQIDPEAMVRALGTKPTAGTPGSRVFVDPESSTRFFVNNSNVVVGVHPTSFQ